MLAEWERRGKPQEMERVDEYGICNTKGVWRKR